MKLPDRTTIISKGIDRVDGPLKVSGRATYAYEHEVEGAAYGFIVPSTIGAGRITGFDLTAAEALPGVVAILTHHNAPEQAPLATPDDADRFEQSRALLQDDVVRRYGQPIALVVAETFEAARDAAHRIEATYEEGSGIFEMDDPRAEPTIPDSLDGGLEADVCRGDFETAFSKAEVQIDVEYTTPNQHASPMEPHAAIASWDGKKLTVYMAVQLVATARKAFANTLKLEPENVRVISPYVGGGFGSKLGVHDEAILAALGAMHTGRPVKIAQTRRQMFASAPHRGRSEQHVRLASTRDGMLIGLAHESRMPMARDYEFAEPTAAPGRASYNVQHLLTRHRVYPVDMPALDSMRAPGDAIGSIGLECAIDELAIELGVDPIELRIKNDAQRDLGVDKPFASRDLVECLRAGAERFGWEPPEKRPSRRREDNWLVGIGVASAVRPHMAMEATANVSIDREGVVTARLDMTDIGTGTYTILAQIVAEVLTVDTDRVKVELGDSLFPKCFGSGGSAGASSSGSATLDAATKLVDRLIEQAVEGPLRGAKAKAITLEDGRLVAGDESVSLADVVRASNEATLDADGAYEPGPEHDELAQYSYGAQFAQVAVAADSGEVRVRRMLGVFSAGRILNQKTARSQLIGGMTFGIGAALFEDAMVDGRYGGFVNRDLAEYHLPVHADVPHIEVHLVGAPDPKANPLGSKGIGELGICGAAAAVGNAIYDATRVRVRDFPITLDKIFLGLD